jgi:superfamily I DNA/RNA helicase
LNDISEAAQSYLANGALETEPIDSIHIYSGPLPLVRVVPDEPEEINLLASFLPIVAHECRLLLESCAVLCPTKEAGLRIAGALDKKGVRATFMTRQQLDLEYPGVKVMTIHSSKGLEFPIVALAGFINSRYAHMPQDVREEGQEEVLERDRRTIFVGMTRAMRTLLVILPANTRSLLLTGFDPTYWNLEQ